MPQSDELSSVREVLFTFFLRLNHFTSSGPSAI